MTTEEKGSSEEKKEKAGKASLKKEALEDEFSGFDFSSLKVNMEEMFKCGVHFGHKKSRKHPRMDEYIFGSRQGINIIDLEKTQKKFEEAMEFIKKNIEEGKTVLFVGTSRQAKNLVKAATLRVKMPYVVERWLGGTFTNFDVVRKRARYLNESQEKLEKGEFEKYTKFERIKKSEELEKLEKKMGGIKNMEELPGAIFAVSVNDDILAIKEARKKGIPVVALVDTNVDPALADYPIPSNDDAVSSIKLMLKYICKAIVK